MRKPAWPMLSQRRSVVLASLVLTLLSLGSATASAAAPTTLWTTGRNCGDSLKLNEHKCGEKAGETYIPRGIATNPTTGHIYVADQSNSRVQEFDAWGQFVRAWGWGVIDGSAELQTCTAVTGCREGLKGSGPGEFASPQGMAVDSAGDVYVVDLPNRRVQKFDSEGHFLLMFGRDVDQGPNHLGNLCTATYLKEGDICEAGAEGTGNGEFSWPGTANSYIGVGPGETVYVGDSERIQEFNPAGEYLKSIPLPGETVESLAINTSGELYAAYCDPKSPFGCKVGKQEIHKLNPTGVTLCTAKVGAPTALAVDPAGNLYVADSKSLGKGAYEETEIRKFNSNCIEDVSFTFSLGKAIDTTIGFYSTGLSTNTVTEAGGVGLYYSDAEPQNSFVRAYYPTPDKWPPPLAPPSIEAQYAVSAVTTEAELRAQINPRFWADTTYRVEYGTQECSKGGCQETPLSQLGAGVRGEGVTSPSILLSGLQPDTTYYYRFISDSSGGGPVRGVGGEVGNDGAEATFHTFALPGKANTSCPNQGFRTAASAKLPDCRAYEMVSPLDKNNGDIAIIETLFAGPVGGRRPRSRLDQAAPDGDAITYSTQRSFADAPSSGWSTQYMTERDPTGGWSTRSISPPRSGYSLYFDLGQELQIKGFSEDLCSAWVLEDSGLALVPGAPAEVPNLYRRSNCGEEGYELLTTEAPPGYSAKSEPVPPGSGYVPYPQGFSADGTRTVFRANAKLTPKACETKGIFQIYESLGEGTLRLISALPNGNGTCTQTTVGNTFGGLTDFRRDSVHHAVSEDATRVYWSASGQTSTAGTAGGKLGPGKLYLRVNADQPQSAISGGKCTQPARACTIAVSEPDSIFWDADPSGATAIYTTGDKLYEFNLATETSQLLAEGVQGLMGTSEDASRVYFVSSKALTGEAVNGEGDKAVADESNLYLYTKGSGPTFIATLSKGDSPGPGEFLSPYNPRPFFRPTRVTPDGNHVAFISKASPTGYDNADVSSGEADAEVYLYDAASKQLDCVSCNPSGARPRGRLTGSEGGRDYWIAAQIPGWESATQPTRVLSDDGKRLFFESFGPLVLADTNGATDVYEWEAAGSGDCSEESAAFSASAGGCVSLISSGESPQDSEFIDASKDGRDVFFTTNASLLPQDPGLVDIYDARAGGGLPPIPAHPPACEGEACQGPLAPPNDPTPGSSSFEGAGNVAEKPAKKKKAHKKHAKKHKRQANHKRRSAR